MAVHSAAQLARRRREWLGRQTRGFRRAWSRPSPPSSNVDTPVEGVTTGAVRPEIAAIGVPSTANGGNMADDDFTLTAGWGHFGASGAVMRGQGSVAKRPLTRLTRCYGIASGGASEGSGEAECMASTSAAEMLVINSYTRPASCWCSR